MFRAEIVIDHHYKGYNPVQLGSQDCAPGHFFGPCVRTHWLLHYVVSGFGKFTYKGVTWKVNPGEFFVIPPYEETYYEADIKQPWNYIWIGFTADEEVRNILNQPVINCPGAGVIFKDMLRAHRMGNGRSAFLSGKIWELFSILLEQDEMNTDHVKKAISYMNAEYVNGITVQQVAEKLNLNRSYFSELFTDEIGISPQRYLINLRMERAAELMTIYGESPSMAAASVGYSDLYHFSKIFKKNFGCSPRSYQNKYNTGKNLENT